MDYSNINHVKKRIFKSLLFIIVIFLISGAISHMFYQINMILRWVTIIAIGAFICNVWGIIVGYNSAVNYRGRIKHLEDDINELKKSMKK